MARSPRHGEAPILVVTLLLLVHPAAAQEAECTPTLPVIRSDQGLTFEADAYARLEWRERSSGGRVLTYATQIWRGQVGRRVAYLTFDEIPGTSGPNHHIAYRLRPYRARIEWKQTDTRYDLGRWFVVRSGPLTGEWTVQNCSCQPALAELFTLDITGFSIDYLDLLLTREADPDNDIIPSPPATPT